MNPNKALVTVEPVQKPTSVTKRVTIQLDVEFDYPLADEVPDTEDVVLDAFEYLEELVTDDALDLSIFDVWVDQEYYSEDLSEDLVADYPQGEDDK